MTSDKVNVYQQRRRQSNVPSADNSQILSAMTQLAWEKDIDLATGCSSLRHQPIPEEHDVKPEGSKVSFVNLAYVGESSTDPPLTEEVPQTEHLVVENMEDVPQTEHLVVENIEDTPQVEGLTAEAMKTAATGVSGSAEIGAQRPGSYDNVAGRSPSGQSSRVGAEQQKKKRRRKRRSSKKNVMADSTKDGTDQDHSDTSEQAAELPHLSPPSSSSSLTCLLKTPEDT